MGGVHMAITSAVEAVEVTTGGALPKKVIQFVKIGLYLSEFPEGQLFVKREHLVFFKLDVQEYLMFGITQNSVFTVVAAIRLQVCVLNGEFKRLDPWCVE